MTTERSNTAPNSGAPGKPFTKNDPRINRKGRPKSFDALRELAQQIAHTEAQTKGQPLVIDGHVVTVAEAMLRRWAASGDARLQIAFMEIAFGKVPTETRITGADGGPVVVQGFDYGAAIGALAPHEEDGNG